MTGLEVILLATIKVAWWLVPAVVGAVAVAKAMVR